MASHAVQAAFYVLLALLPPLGLATAQAQGQEVAFLGLAIPKLVATSKPLARQLKDVHEYLGDAMIAFIALHVAASLWHQFVRRDDTLKRMLG